MQPNDKRIFVVSDTHFGHKGICEFTNSFGQKERPWTNPDEMDEDMVKLWNDTVRPNDKVYHLGDVVINHRSLKTVERLNGDKVLIKGNHDIYKHKDYLKYFRDIRAYQVIEGCILSHIPIHPLSLSRFGCNIHGHLHSGRVTLTDGSIDPKYFCVSVEHIGFKPIELTRVFELIKQQGGTIQFKSKGDTP